MNILTYILFLQTKFYCSDNDGERNHHSKIYKRYEEQIVPSNGNNECEIMKPAEVVFDELSKSNCKIDEGFKLLGNKLDLTLGSILLCISKIESRYDKKREGEKEKIETLIGFIPEGNSSEERVKSWNIGNGKNHDECVKSNKKPEDNIETGFREMPASPDVDESDDMLIDEIHEDANEKSKDLLIPFIPLFNKYVYDCIGCYVYSLKTSYEKDIARLRRKIALLERCGKKDIKAYPFDGEFRKVILAEYKELKQNYENKLKNLNNIDVSEVKNECDDKARLFLRQEPLGRIDEELVEEWVIEAVNTRRNGLKQTKIGKKKISDPIYANITDTVKARKRSPLPQKFQDMYKDGISKHQKFLEVRGDQSIGDRSESKDSIRVEKGKMTNMCKKDQGRPFEDEDLLPSECIRDLHPTYTGNDKSEICKCIKDIFKTLGSMTNVQVREFNLILDNLPTS